MLLEVLKMADFADSYNNLLKESETLARELEELLVEIKQADERREGSPFGKREEAATEALAYASLCLKCKSTQPKSNRGRLTG
jgi:hypothetical protein